MSSLGNENLKDSLNLEMSISKAIEKKLIDGTIEKIITDQFEKSVIAGINSLFSEYGEVTEIIKKKIKTQFQSKLEEFNYNEYITKLDLMLTNVVKNSPHSKIMNNFKGLMCFNEKYEGNKQISIENIFDNYSEYVDEYIDTTNLEIIYDDSVYYESPEITYSFDIEKDNYSSYFQHALIQLRCSKDDNVNLDLKLIKTINQKNWKIDGDLINNINIKSLRYIEKFIIFIINLFQNDTEIIIDEDETEGYMEVEITSVPEPDYT